MKSNLDNVIRGRIETFLGELTNLVRLAALQAVHDALGQKLSGGIVEVAPVPVAAPVAAVPKARKAKGKRSQGDVLKIAEHVLLYIKGNEGQRLEQIGKGLGVATKGLKLPIQKLFEQKAIRTEGEKRGTKYFMGTPANVAKKAKAGKKGKK